MKKEEEELLRELFVETGPESPSRGFHQSVINQIARQTKGLTYEPVISPKGIKWIVGILIVFFFTIILVTPSSESSFTYLDPIVKLSSQKLNLSTPSSDIFHLVQSPILSLSLILFCLASFLSTLLIAIKKLRYSQ